MRWMERSTSRLASPTLDFWALDFSGPAWYLIWSGGAREPMRDFVAALDHVFGEEVKDLRTIVRGGSCPTCGVARGFNSVANVFAVAERRFAEQFAFASENGERVAGVGTRLFAADVLLHSAVDIARGSCDCQSVRRCGLAVVPICVLESVSFFAASRDAAGSVCSHFGVRYSYMPSRPPSRP